LFSLLKKKDAKRARIIDKDNKRRLVRALEIAIKTNSPIPELKKQKNFDILFLGIKKDKEELQKRIEKRLLKRLDQGMIKEVKKLKASGISYKKLYDFGLEYRYLSLFLQNKITYQEMISLLQKEIEKYAKRQMTWFKKDKRIIWIKNKKEMLSLVKNFLN